MLVLIGVYATYCIVSSQSWHYRVDKMSIGLALHAAQTCVSRAEQRPEGLPSCSSSSASSFAAETNIASAMYAFYLHSTWFHLLLPPQYKYAEARNHPNAKRSKVPTTSRWIFSLTCSLLSLLGPSRLSQWCIFVAATRS